DRKTESLEKARRSVIEESKRWSRREAVVKAQVDKLDAEAERLEREADALAIERDVLARERDAAKAELVKDRSRAGGYAVLPHKGPNGTWQRPVVIECVDGTAVLPPRELRFSLVELNELL